MQGSHQEQQAAWILRGRARGREAPPSLHALAGGHDQGPERVCGLWEAGLGHLVAPQSQLWVAQDPRTQPLGRDDLVPPTSTPPSHGLASCPGPVAAPPSASSSGGASPGLLLGPHPPLRWAPPGRSGLLSISQNGAPLPLFSPPAPSPPPRC